MIKPRMAKKGHDVPVGIRHDCNMSSELNRVAHKTITTSDLTHSPLTGVEDCLGT